MSNKGKTEFWDARKQEPLVEELVSYVQSGDVLDMGAGHGRDAFYLANCGFNVTAADADEEALNVLAKKNSESAKPLKVIKVDILTYQPVQQFDVIICDMVLHFLSTDGVKKAVMNLQDWTKPSGYNLVTAYTTKNPPGKRPYLFAPNELLSFYAGWELLIYKEVPTPWFKLKGESAPRRNEAVYLLARRSR